MGWEGRHYRGMHRKISYICPALGPFRVEQLLGIQWMEKQGN